MDDDHAVAVQGLEQLDRDGSCQSLTTFRLRQPVIGLRKRVTIGQPQPVRCLISYR